MHCTVKVVCGKEKRYRYVALVNEGFGITIESNTMSRLNEKVKTMLQKMLEKGANANIARNPKSAALVEN